MKRGYILNILHGLYSSLPKQSGYSIRSKYIIENQKKYGLNTIVVTPPLFMRDELVENINGIFYFRTKAKFKKALDIPFIKHIYNMKLFEKRVEQVVLENDIDLIHAHSSFFVGKPMLNVAKKHNIPFIYEVRGIWEDTAVSSNKMKHNGFKYQYYRKQENFVIKNADSVVCISQGLKNDINSRELGVNNIQVIPNGVDIKNFNQKISLQEMEEIKERLNIKEEIILGYVSSFTKMEGIDLLIRVINLIPNLNIKLLLVGDGPELDNLKRIVLQEGLEDKVVFTGRVPHERVNLYYSLIDIFVIPRVDSRVTNIVTPLKPIEAMARKKAIVASDVGGLSEMITNNYNGLLFKSDDINELAKAIILLVKDKDKRDKLSSNGYRWVLENRQWNKLIKRYIPVYEKYI